jgi:hypothetical protein
MALDPVTHTIYVAATDRVGAKTVDNSFKILVFPMSGPAPK